LRHTGYQGSLVKRLEQHADTLAFQHFFNVGTTILVVSTMSKYALVTTVAN
jgi:hypothetical protein